MSLGQKLDNLIERMEKPEAKEDDIFARFINSPFRTTSTSIIEEAKTPTVTHPATSKTPTIKISPK